MEKNCASKTRWFQKYSINVFEVDATVAENCATICRMAIMSVENNKNGLDRCRLICTRLGCKLSICIEWNIDATLKDKYKVAVPKT